MVALGTGLGPLTLIMAYDMIRRRDRQARCLVLARGADHGGGLHVIVLLQGQAEHVQSIVPTLEAVKSDIGCLTLARAVDFEWLDVDVDNEVVESSSADLIARLFGDAAEV